MSKLSTYSPLDVKMIFKGIEAKGFKKGTFIKVTRNTPVWSTQIGADGEVTRVQTGDDTGMVEMTLQAASPTNKAFSLVIQSDRQNRDGVGVCSVRDLNGLDIHTSEEAFIMSSPDAEYAEEPGDRVWKIFCTNIFSFSGGSVL